MFLTLFFMFWNLNLINNDFWKWPKKSGQKKGHFWTPQNVQIWLFLTTFWPLFDHPFYGFFKTEKKSLTGTPEFHEIHGPEKRAQKRGQKMGQKDHLWSQKTFATPAKPQKSWFSGVLVKTGIFGPGQTPPSKSVNMSHWKYPLFSQNDQNDQKSHFPPKPCVFRFRPKTPKFHDFPGFWVKSWKSGVWVTQNDPLFDHLFDHPIKHGQNKAQK